MDNFITVADFHSGIQTYMAWTTCLFLLITLFVVWVNQKDVKKTVKSIEEKFKKHKTEMSECLIELQAASYRIQGTNAEKEGAHDMAFANYMKSANLYSKIGGANLANPSLYLAVGSLENVKSFSRMIGCSIGDFAEIFVSIKEMRERKVVNRGSLDRIEVNFNKKYKSSLAEQEG